MPDSSPAPSQCTVDSETTEIIESDQDEGDTTKSFADKIGKVATTARPDRRMPFKFRKFLDEDIKEAPSPSSSPIPLPSPEVFEISSDEELEKSMVMLEERWSQNGY